jgi:UDPglucose 6-dehydrogenase
MTDAEESLYVNTHTICIVGTGYVGLVTGACLAELGHRVTCLDIDEQKIALLRSGRLPIYEPGLDELVARNVACGRLTFTTCYKEALRDVEFVFIAVNTPAGANGEADLRYVRAAAESIGRALSPDHPHIVTIVNKSTVPIGTGDLVERIVARWAPPGVRFRVVSNPEFLREGAAIHDFMHPDRIVLGAADREAAEAVAELYAVLDCPVLITDLRTAEMIKYASNAFLATKISFINEVASICEQVGADVRKVAEGMGLDRRIGRAFLDAGLGWGGSCFPKDVQALTHMAAVYGAHPQLLRAVTQINRDQRLKVIRWLREALGILDESVIALLGLSFKPNTDDVREAPALDIARMLLQEGAHVRGYDPVAGERARAALPELVVCASALEAVQGADAAVLVTEWDEFRTLDLHVVRSLMRRPVLVDGRNVYSPEAARRAGLEYYAIGGGRRAAPAPANAVAVGV